MSTDRSNFQSQGNTSLMSRTGRLTSFLWFAAAALIAAAVVLQMNTDNAKKSTQDNALRSLATREAASLDNYFEEARKLNLIGASDIAYQEMFKTARDPWRIVHSGGSGQVDAMNTALANFHTLYPDAIGEACVIAYNGHEVARITGSDRAPVSDLSDDESGSAMFKPTFELSQGEVYQAAPYFSPDMKSWVISNSTLIPWSGDSPAFVHFEVGLASFQKAAQKLAGKSRIQIVDAETGRVLIDTKKTFREDENKLGSGDSKPYAAQVRGAKAQFITTKGSNRVAMNELVASNTHNANKWYVAATEPVVATGILHPTGTALMLLLVAGAMIALNLVVRKAVRQHVSRIDRLVEVTTAAAANADLDVKISDGKDDELGHLGDSFETILGSMREATSTARRIAAGDIHAKISTRAEGDALGQAFTEMQKYLFHMAEVADSIASGNLNTRFEVKGKDDELGMSFLKMQEKLRSGIGDVSASSQQLSSSSHMLATTSTELTSGVEGVADSVTAIVAAVDEYSTLVSRTRESAEEAMTAASHAGALTKSGMDAAGEARQAMDELRHASAGVTEAIRELAGRSTQITSIVDTITDISEQTNLLALNAAIEAARAGEHGRGFAVVADEVRKLAEESGQAAQMIAKIVSQINADTDRTVAIVGETAQSTESGAKVVDAASDALREISTSVNEVVGSVSTIRSATDEVATVISSTAESIVQVSAVTQQVAASMVEVSDSARSLSALATTLEDVTSQFTIGDEAGRRPALRRVV